MLVAIVLDGPGDGHFFAVSGADIGVKILADVILGQPIIDRFTVLLHLENVPAGGADVQRTFAAGQQAGERDGRIGVVRESLRRGDHPQQSGSEKDHEIFHI